MKRLIMDINWWRVTAVVSFASAWVLYFLDQFPKAIFQMLWGIAMLLGDMDD